MALYLTTSDFVVTEYLGGSTFIKHFKRRTLCYRPSMRTRANQTPKLNICHSSHLQTGARKTETLLSSVNANSRKSNWIFATVRKCELEYSTKKLSAIVRKYELVQIKHQNLIFATVRWSTHNRNSAIPSMRTRTNQIEYLLQLASANLNIQKVNSLLSSVNVNSRKSNWIFATVRKRELEHSTKKHSAIVRKCELAQIKHQNWIFALANWSTQKGNSAIVRQCELGQIKHQNWIFATVRTCELEHLKRKLCYRLSMQSRLVFGTGTGKPAGLRSRVWRVRVR